MRDEQQHCLGNARRNQRSERGGHAPPHHAQRNHQARTKAGGEPSGGNLKTCIANEERAEDPSQALVSQPILRADLQPRNGNIRAVEKRDGAKNEKPECEQKSLPGVAFCIHRLLLLGAAEQRPQEMISHALAGAVRSRMIRLYPVEAFVCFSASANFVGSAVLGAIGVATLTEVKHRRELLFAAMPLPLRAAPVHRGFCLAGARSQAAAHRGPRRGRQPSSYMPRACCRFSCR